MSWFELWEGREGREGKGREEREEGNASRKKMTVKTNDRENIVAHVHPSRHFPL